MKLLLSSCCHVDRALLSEVVFIRHPSIADHKCHSIFGLPTACNDRETTHLDGCNSTFCLPVDCLNRKYAHLDGCDGGDGSQRIYEAPARQRLPRPLLGLLLARPLLAHKLGIIHLIRNVPCLDRRDVTRCMSLLHREVAERMGMLSPVP